MHWKSPKASLLMQYTGRSILWIQSTLENFPFKINLIFVIHLLMTWAESQIKSIIPEKSIQLSQAYSNMSLPLVLCNHTVISYYLFPSESGHLGNPPLEHPRKVKGLVSPLAHSQDVGRHFLKAFFTLRRVCLRVRRLGISSLLSLKVSEIIPDGEIVEPSSQLQVSGNMSSPNLTRKVRQNKTWSDSYFFLYFSCCYMLDGWCYRAFLLKLRDKIRFSLELL